jgi:hypothetical protein
MTPSRSLNFWEIGAALVVFALGAFMVWEGSHYPFGSLTRMGPGFFPIVLGLVLMGFGAALVVEVRHLQTPAPDFRLRSFSFIVAGLIAFAFMLDRFGLVPATIALIVLSALADRPVRPRAIAGTAVVVAAMAYFVFLRGFGLQLQAFVW